MALKPLLTLFGAPNANTIFHKPFYDKGCLIGNTAYTVKHEHEEDVKLFLPCRVFDKLYLIPVFGPYLMAGYAFFLFFLDDYPAHAFSELVTLQALHRNIGFILFIVVYLLISGNTVEAAYSISCCWGVFNCVVWDNARFIHINPSSLV